MESFRGRWTANLDKSRRHSNHLFQSATLEFAFDGDAVSLTHSGINAKGESESATQRLIADGQPRPVSEQMPNIMVKTEWLSPNLLSTSATKDGLEIGKGTYEVSANGRELTATVSGIDASDAPFDHVIVFDREE